MAIDGPEVSFKNKSSTQGQLFSQSGLRKVPSIQLAYLLLVLPWEWAEPSALPPDSHPVRTVVSRAGHPQIQHRDILRDTSQTAQSLPNREQS